MAQIAPEQEEENVAAHQFDDILVAIHGIGEQSRNATVRYVATRLARTGFTEVFWADIPQDVVKEGRTIEETKAWARTVVARARAICKHRIREQGTLPPTERLSNGS